MYRHKYVNGKNEYFSFRTLNTGNIFNMVNLSKSPYSKSIERYYDHKHKYLLPWSTINNEWLLLGHDHSNAMGNFYSPKNLFFYEVKTDFSYKGITSEFQPISEIVFEILIKNHERYYDSLLINNEKQYLMSLAVRDYMITKPIEPSHKYFKKLFIFLTPNDLIKVHDHFLLEIPICFRNSEFNGHARNSEQFYLPKVDYRHPTYTQKVMRSLIY